MISTAPLKTHKWRQEWWVWAAPLCLYVFLSSLYLMAVPLGESPDEPGHLQCVQQVAVANRLPIIDPKASGQWWQPETTLSGRMCYHMPLYYLIAGGAQKAISLMSGTPLRLEFPAFNQRFPETGVMFLHPQAIHPFQVTEPMITFGLRLLSMVLGGVVVIATVFIGRTVFPAEPTTVLFGALLAAGWPQFLFMSRAISNDMLVTALLCLVLMALIHRGRPYRYIWAAIFSGLAVLTKASAIYAPTVVLCVWTIEYVLTPFERSRLRRALMVALFVWGIVAMTIGASATLREHWRLSGDVFSYMNPRVVTLDHWLSWLELSIASGWARFGWMNVAPSPWMGQLWWLTVSLLVILGMYRWWTGGAAGKRWLTSVFCLWAVGVFAAYLRINLTVLQPQFRFLMALIPILAVFAGGGVRKITPASQFAPMAVGVGLSVLLTAMNLWLVFGVIVPFYDIGL